MLTLEKRGKVFHAVLWAGGTRVRGSLGTKNQDAAKRICYKLETALSEGAESALWRKLEPILPSAAFARFSEHVGFKDKQLPTWSALQATFNAHMEQRQQIGKLSASTVKRYSASLTEFDAFLGEQNLSMLQEITKPVVEAYKVWRTNRISKRKESRGATSLVLDVAILHRVFSFALDAEMIIKNPVKMEGRPGENPTGGAEPFNAKELQAMREAAGEDLLAFLLLRWTGLRGSDAVSLTFSEVDFEQQEIARLTQKRKKKVVLPIQTELLFALEAEHQRRKPKLSDCVLLNPLTGTRLTRPRLYHRMLALGKRAGVADAHPHRFRDTLAVDMLSRGASPYDVAKMLGDTIETVEKHYTPFVKELRERVRGILENERGIEKTATPQPQSARAIQ